MVKKSEILGKINLDRKVLKKGFIFLSINQKLNYFNQRTIYDEVYVNMKPQCERFIIKRI